MNHTMNNTMNNTMNLPIKYTPFNSTSLSTIINGEANDASSNTINTVCDGQYIIKKKDEFTIIKYNKSALNNENTTQLGLFRSLIMNNDQIVSFSPQKSTNYHNFIHENEFDKCSITEYIDGTMINIFYNENCVDKDDFNVPRWEICTRSNIGANCRFNLDNKKTFREMFLEACVECKLDFQNLNIDCCYSFVLQHPENKIVTHITKPNLVLTKVFTFNDDNEVFDVTEKEKNIGIELPPTYPDINSWDDIENLCSGERLKFDVVGFIVYNEKGVRTKIRNMAYENAKHLKGNVQKMFLQYLFLRKANEIDEFLTYFPEYKNEFNNYRRKLYKWTNKLYIQYVNTFILKKNSLKNAPFEFKPVLYNIQKQYLEVLKPNNQKITFKYIVKCVAELHPKKVMFCVNYKLQKKERAETQVVTQEAKQS